MKWGFHSVPSLNRLHMHCISNDYSSPFMKTKQHYLSFNSPFFVSASDLTRKLELEGVAKFDPEKQQAYLKGILLCNFCGEDFEKWSKLKAHRLSVHASSVSISNGE